MHFKLVIPARYASTRLPGKPLREIAGKPMIQHVYERALESGAEQVVVATDDQRIAEAVTGFGGEVCITSAGHQSGTDRIAEVTEKYRWPDESILVNLQGDEPLMPPKLLTQVASDMEQHQDAAVTTLSAPITEKERLMDPHLVKVVTDGQGYALYFSRAPIPWHRDEFLRSESRLPAGTPFQAHVGLYAYRAGFLKRYVGWPASPLEQAESLEQLRVLWHGEKIHVSQARVEPGHGVDTESDLHHVERLLSARC